MTNEKFTPGEWSVDIEHHGVRIIPNIAWLGEKSSMERQENIANAHLIAAAPEMYEKLKTVLALCEGGLLRKTRCDVLGNEIEELLKKARGER